MTVDLRTREMRVAGIPCLHRVARLLEQPGQVDPQRRGDPLDIRAQGDAVHTPDADEGNVRHPQIDQRVAICRVEVAEGGERLPECQR